MFNITGVTANLEHRYLMSAVSAAFSITGIDATLTYTPVTGWTQAAFRFYNDGTESGSTAIAAQNVNITQAANILTAIRIQANTSGDQPTKQMKIQVKQTAASDSNYRDIPVGL